MNVNEYTTQITKRLDDIKKVFNSYNLIVGENSEIAFQLFATCSSISEGESSFSVSKDNLIFEMLQTLSFLVNHKKGGIVLKSKTTTDSLVVNKLPSGCTPSMDAMIFGLETNIRNIADELNPTTDIYNMIGEDSLINDRINIDVWLEFFRNNIGTPQVYEPQEIISLMGICAILKANNLIELNGFGDKVLKFTNKECYLLYDILYAASGRSHDIKSEKEKESRIRYLVRTAIKQPKTIIKISE